MSQITTHILDTAQGAPAAGISVALAQRRGGEWVELGAGVSDGDGRVANLLAADATLPAGECKLIFDTGDYHQDKDCGDGAPAFYPRIEVTFRIDDSGAHYHIPLLLSRFGYSTYRGS